MNTKELKKARDYKVVKSNELVQKSRFALSLPEQKTIAYICSLIKPRDDFDTVMGTPFQLEYKFNIRDYCKICGFDYDNGKNYINAKETLKKLRDRSMWLTLPDGSETLCGWLAKVTTNKKSGIVTIKIDEDLVPYLFDLKGKFTQYTLRKILGMQSAYSVRIYEILKSHAFQNNISYKLDDLKKLLMVEDIKSYADVSLFKIKVLDVAMREINELTDLEVEYKTIKDGRKIDSIKFLIKKKDSFEEYITDCEVDEMLDRKE